jgi:hypothetical protein
MMTHLDSQSACFRISDFNGARLLMNGELAPVTGAVRSVYTYLNMYVIYLTTFKEVNYSNNSLDAELLGPLAVLLLVCFFK